MLQILCRPFVEVVQFDILGPKESHFVSQSVTPTRLKEPYHFIALSKMLQAIPLPPFSEKAIAVIGVPNASSNPPSVADITNAIQYANILQNANGLSGISLSCVP